MDDISSAVWGGRGIKHASVSLGVDEEEEDVECRRELGGKGGSWGVVPWVVAWGVSRVVSWAGIKAAM
jgi:hypothetical protein